MKINFLYLIPWQGTDILSFFLPFSFCSLDSLVMTWLCLICFELYFPPYPPYMPFHAPISMWWFIKNGFVVHSIAEEWEKRDRLLDFSSFDKERKVREQGKKNQRGAWKKKFPGLSWENKEKKADAFLQIIFGFFFTAFWLKTPKICSVISLNYYIYISFYRHRWSQNFVLRRQNQRAYYQYVVDQSRNDNR